jgi:hypothetical protein
MSATKERKLSFKIGFFSKLAAEGVLPSAFLGHVKSADSTNPLAALLRFGYGEGKGLAGLVAGQAVPAAKLIGAVGTAAPIGLGITTGSIASKLNDPPEPDIEAMRKEEMIELYRRLANEVRARNRSPEA